VKKRNLKFPPINGYVKPGFEKVKNEFIKNFEKRGELGAACCIYLKGEKVVDLRGDSEIIRQRSLGKRIQW